MDLAVGALRLEVADQLAQQIGAHAHGRADHRLARCEIGRAAQFPFQFARTGDDLLRPFVDALPGGGQGDAPAFAADQRRAQLFLQAADVRGDDRLGDEQVVRGARHALQFGHHAEDLEFLQGEVGIEASHEDSIHR